MKDEFNYGDLVAFPWGSGEIRGTVAEVYGPKGGRQVVIALDPDISGYVVDEPTTVALPVEEVHRVAAA